MPKYDGSGPMGEGAMTGRRMGQCMKDSLMSQGQKQGRRLSQESQMGFNKGRRFREMNDTVKLSKESLLVRKEMLLNRQEILQLKLDEVNSQLESM